MKRSDLAYGVGFSSHGRHKRSSNNKHTPEYMAWKNMLWRCYGKDHGREMRAYIGCSVCLEWHDFQNFAEWLVVQPGWGLARLELDKDIISPGCLIYSPSTCALVPKFINLMVAKKINDNGLPPGVSWDSSRGKYKAQCSDGCGRNRFIGRFSCPELAAEAYKRFKKSVIMRVAMENKQILDPRIFDALISYRI